MLYIIDGYNLLYRVADPDDRFGEKREEMIRQLAKRFSRTKQRLLVVFDAYKKEEECRRTHYRQIEIVYTAFGETADMRILREVQRREHPSNLTVVTSDKDLAWRSRRFGAKTEEVDRFLTKIPKAAMPLPKSKLPKKRKETKEEKKPLDKNEARYLELFEKRLEESGIKVEKAASNFERWLKIFEERLKEDE